jgi:hypothetical protein
MEDKAEKPANDMSNGAVKNVSEEQNAPEKDDVNLVTTPVLPKGRPRGRPRKTHTTPAKKPDSAEEEGENCVCKNYYPEEISIACDNCEVYWHLCCVGLKGLTNEMLKALERWECPNCFYCPHKCADVKTPILNTVSADETNQLIKQLNPVIRFTIQEAIRIAIPDALCNKGDITAIMDNCTDHAVKTYAKAAAVTQKKVLDEMSLAQASKKVVEEVVHKMDVDKIEREKRLRNVVVNKVPESKDTDSKRRNEEDLKFCVETLEIPTNDIETCYRAGRKDSDDGKGGDYCRPLVIKMVDQTAADYWCDFGKGFKTVDGHYINPDLCKADRKASFLAREEKRKRRNGANPTTDAPKKTDQKK